MAKSYNGHKSKKNKERLTVVNGTLYKGDINMQISKVSFIAVSKDGKAEHGTATIATASSRGTNCELRALADKGCAVVKYDSKQAKLSADAVKPHAKAIADTLNGTPDEKNAVYVYIMDVLTTANLFKSEKIVK